MSIAVRVNTFFFASNSDVNFRAWGNTFSTQLAAAGMVLVDNSINWSTVLAPTVITTHVGYEVWRFNDAFQSSAPVFFKIEYGANNPIATPMMWINFGSGYSSATQQLTGPTLAGINGGPSAGRLRLMPASTASTNLATFFSGDTDRFSFVYAGSNAGIAGSSMSTNFKCMCGFERTRDANGNTTGQGVCITAAGSIQAAFNVLWDTQIGCLTQVEASVGCLTPGSGAITTGVNGANTAVYPWFHCRGASFANPNLNFLSYYNADFAANVATTIPMYGVNHTYMPFGTLVYTGPGLGMPRADSNIAIMMRYE